MDRIGPFFEKKLEKYIHKPISKKDGFERIDDLVSKGFNLLQEGRGGQGIKCFNKALKIDPRNINVWNNKGVCLLSMGRYQDAIECFEKAIEINPKYMLAWINKCIALMHLGKKMESHLCFNQAFEAYK